MTSVASNPASNTRQGTPSAGRATATGTLPPSFGSSLEGLLANRTAGLQPSQVGTAPAAASAPNVDPAASALAGDPADLGTARGAKTPAGSPRKPEKSPLSDPTQQGMVPVTLLSVTPGPVANWALSGALGTPVQAVQGSTTTSTALLTGNVSGVLGDPFASALQDATGFAAAQTSRGTSEALPQAASEAVIAAQQLPQPPETLDAVPTGELLGQASAIQADAPKPAASGFAIKPAAPASQPDGAALHRPAPAGSRAEARPGSSESQSLAPAKEISQLAEALARSAVSGGAPTGVAANDRAKGLSSGPKLISGSAVISNSLTPLSRVLPNALSDALPIASVSDNLQPDGIAPAGLASVSTAMAQATSSTMQLVGASPQDTPRSRYSPRSTGTAFPTDAAFQLPGGLTQGQPGGRAESSSAAPQGAAVAAARQASQNSPPESLASLSTAQLVQSLGRSAMQLQVHAAEFGRVSVQATYGREGIAAQIGVQHPELHTALSAQLPGIAQKLEGQHGMPASVSVSVEARTASDGGQRGGDAPPERPRLPTLPSASSASPAELTPAALPTVAARLDGRNGQRIDIHI